MKKLRLNSILLVALALLPVGASGQTLVTTQFVVVGEGLAAGMADFALRDVYQKMSFPAQMAVQMKTAFPQPLLQSPGISGGAPGFPTLPSGFPVTSQGSVRDDFPPNLFVFNLSIPGAKLADTLNVRPSFPLIQQANLKQTLVNFILGYPTLIIGQTLPLLSQADYAAGMNPTLVVVEVGYYDVLDAAVNDDPSRLPVASTFAANYATLLSRFGSTAQIVVMTIPDPFDTAYFTSPTSATRLLGAPPATLSGLFGVGTGDSFTPNGLMAAGNLIMTNKVTPGSPLSRPDMVVSAATQTAVENSVTALNNAITAAAKQAGSNVVVFDLHALFHTVRTNGLTVGPTTLTADYLGGFYSLDGYYPGQTGQGLIANQMLTFLNTTYKTSFPMLDLTKIAPADPAVGFAPSFVKKPVSRPVRGIEK